MRGGVRLGEFTSPLQSTQRTDDSVMSTETFFTKSGGSPPAAAAESTAIVVHEQSSQLANLDRARQMLAESRTLPEVKKIRDIAEAAKVYAKAAHLGRESQNYAAEIALLASRKAGEILKQLERDTPKQAGAKKGAASVAGASEYAKTLKETNTPERTAQYWQKLASVSSPAVGLQPAASWVKSTWI